MSNKNQTSDNQQGHAPLAGVTARFSVGDIINIISFGEPSTEKLIEWSEENQMFKCQFDGGEATGSCWRTVENILEMQDRVDKYRKRKRKENDRYWRTGGNNGPTGHGDICFSDADPGL